VLVGVDSNAILVVVASGGVMLVMGAVVQLVENPRPLAAVVLVPRLVESAGVATYLAWIPGTVSGSKCSFTNP
jgi:hypothetical protein